MAAWTDAGSPGSNGLGSARQVFMKPPNRHYRSLLTAPRLLRLLLGLALVVGGILGFLPILGFWMIPLGILVIFFDVPWVRDIWRRIRGWWKVRRARWRPSPPADDA